MKDFEVLEPAFTEFTEWTKFVNALDTVGFFPEQDSPEYVRKLETAKKKFRAQYPGASMPAGIHLRSNTDTL